MNINWFKDEDHLVYLDAEKELKRLEKLLKLPGLEAAARELHAAPVREGITLNGARRTSAKLFIPDLLFGEHIEMGENLFLYLGEMTECYVLYWVDEPAGSEQS